ncbi:long-chain fatty acid outer membrane transporter [Endozoicomonas montiporae]|uniref:Long-chain fatty acid outer membrane transporter n=2 Tax=Endozoicomonas montiporae TaxID=1027273 RepID=A0A081N9R5_9GAMM|nr:outer membrane protein transport protein [Endozoicomonas montiporae]AMO55044.1 long-chain fatty acid transport protein [Endozoicomonas montiporae CL-33]KEQ15188.1 long-chain fatty acid outer membrane transporter [Endozoicomonas montiporae]
MNKKCLLKKTLLATMIALASQHAAAAGFLLVEDSATGLGRAFAGEGAIADNAAVGARNPAAMATFDTAAFSVGLSYINPSVDTEVHSATFGDTGKAKDIAPDAWVPNIHYIHPVSDKFAVGTSVFSNFGLSTEYPKNVGSLGGGNTELMTVNWAVNGSYRMNEQFSIGAGVNVLYADAEMNRYIPPGSPVSGGQRAVKMKGDGYGYGWNAGLLWEISPQHRIALTYRSSIDTTLKGKGDFLSQGITNTSAEMDIEFPDLWELSGYHRVATKWALSYSVLRTGWSSFKELKAESSSCTVGKGVCFEKAEYWKDSWRYSAGVTHYLNNQWTLRAGVALDRSPVKGEYRTMSIPDSDRYWYTVGATYSIQDNSTIDIGFAYLDGDAKKGTETDMVGNVPVVYEFEAGGDAYIFAVQYSYWF